MSYRAALALTLLALAPAAAAQAETPSPSSMPSARDMPEAELPLPTWQLATPWQWQRPGKVGEPAEAQLRFAMPPEVTISLPCSLTEPPSVKVTRLREGGEEEPLWLTLSPVWDAPSCQEGLLVLPAGQRGQYRADMNGLPAGTYRLSGFWFGGKVGDLMGTPEQTLVLEE